MLEPFKNIDAYIENKKHYTLDEREVILLEIINNSKKIIDIKTLL